MCIQAVLWPTQGQTGRCVDGETERQSGREDAVTARGGVLLNEAYECKHG